jgi:hypothetical protein
MCSGTQPWSQTGGEAEEEDSLAQSGQQSEAPFQK